MGSGMQRRIGISFPTLVHWREHHMGDLRKEILRKTAGMPPPQIEFKIPKKEGKEAPTFEPLGWDLFFDSQMRTEDGFLVYRAGPSASSSSSSAQLRPYVFLLHGAGYTSLSWSLVAVRAFLLLFTPRIAVPIISDSSCSIIISVLCVLGGAKESRKRCCLRFSRPWRYKDFG